MSNSTPRDFNRQPFTPANVKDGWQTYVTGNDGKQVTLTWSKGRWVDEDGRPWPSTRSLWGAIRDAFT